MAPGDGNARPSPQFSPGRGAPQDDDRGRRDLTAGKTVREAAATGKIATWAPRGSDLKRPASWTIRE